MKLSSLYKFFIGEITITMFKNEIKKNVEVYDLKMQTRGSSILVTAKEDFNFMFKSKYLLKLCDCFLDNKLNYLELEYIADCISLSECVSYESDKLLDYLDIMTDSKINGEITKEKIIKLKIQLFESTSGMQG